MLPSELTEPRPERAGRDRAAARRDGHDKRYVPTATRASPHSGRLTFARRLYRKRNRVRPCFGGGRGGGGGLGGGGGGGSE